MKFGSRGGEPDPAATLLHCLMVEAPGIEPGSGSTTSKRLHAYWAFWFSNPETPAKKLFRILSLFVSPEDQGQLPQTSLLIDASDRVAGVPGEAHSFIKLRVPVRCWRLCFLLPFYVVTVPRHAT